MARTRPAAGFRHPWAFWLGVAGITGGVALHVPMFLSAKSNHYMLRGMPMDTWMLIGMALIVAGYASVIYGLAPRFSRDGHDSSGGVELRALDSSKLTAAHYKLMLVLMLGIAVDTQKPFTFTFILPGVASEYNLRSPAHPAPGHWPVALFPFIAIVGTVLGSLLWGRLGDSIGRRASILLAGTLFIGTAMCSAMPAYQWNLVACFFMGVAAGGLLPIAYSLLTEIIPAKRRGETIVLVAGIGTALGFLLASWSAHWLIPTFGWRIMWFFGVPTGLALILLNRYIPESPRFLLANGYGREARDVMRRFGVSVVEDDGPAAVAPALPPRSGGFSGVFRRPYSLITPVLTLYGLAWGLVNFGFLVWLPLYVSKQGVSTGQVTAILAKAALFAIPGSVAVAWLYSRWSSRGTLVVAATVQAAALLAIASSGGAIVHRTSLFTALLVLLLVSLWATISSLSPYSAEIYPTEFRGAGSGVAAAATKLGGVIALGMSVFSWAPPGLAGAALLGAIPAGAAALLLFAVGIETRGRRLEEIATTPSSADAPRQPRKRTLRIRGTDYPVIFPSWKDARLHVSATFVCLHTLGQVEFHFRLSIPQILAALLTCGLIEVVVTFKQKRVFLWPASALLTGNGIAFIMRIPGTRHGDWWTFHGVWIYIAVAAVSMASKYLIQFRGKHVFNPSNLGLVLCYLLLGSGRAEPLQFWWGPMSPALAIVLAVIIGGGLLALSRVNQLAVAALFWVTFSSALGILALSGHAFSANWHLGPVADGYFWKVLITSPEVFIFLAFMITDPKTSPLTERGRRIYAISIGLLGALLIAPMQTEFAAKVGLLSALTIVCAARPLIVLAQEAVARRKEAGTWSLPSLPRRRPVLAAAAALGAAGFAGLIVAAGSPARTVPALAASSLSNTVGVTIVPTQGVVALDRATANRAAAAAVAELHRSAPSSQIGSVSLQLQQAKGQAPPTVLATLNGRQAQAAFTRTVGLQLEHGQFRVVGAAPAALATPKNTDRSKGTAAFSEVHLTDVASNVGLDFRQDSFRYSMSDDPQAMMGGGVCWLDYNNDGWLDLFAVNSYTDSDTQEWGAQGGFPRSALFRNEHGTFTNVSASSGAGIRVKGTGCVAADLNGDGYTDLVVTTATGIDLLWNNGNGTFTQAASESGINPAYAWYAGAAVADVNGDGRPDLFVAGYTNMLDRIQNSIAGFPTNYRGVRDLLYLNEGNAANGHARFREVGVEAGLESNDFSHGLGASFTDVNGDGRPDLYVANDSDPNQLYINEAGGPLGFHFVNEAKADGVADPNAGMGVAAGDYNGDGQPDLFITNSRGQPHAAYQSTGIKAGRPGYAPEMAKFGAALARTATVGWGDSWVDLNNDSIPDLIVANGAIPVTSLTKDTEPIQVLQNLNGTSFENASGIISQAGLPKIIGRGLAAADYNNDGRMDVAINTTGGPLVLLENTGATGNWLEVALTGFHPNAVISATLPDGRTLVDELHAGSSYLSSEDPRAHFGLGADAKVARLTIRYPDGTETHLDNVAANQILTVKTP